MSTSPLTTRSDYSSLFGAQATACWETVIASCYWTPYGLGNPVASDVKAISRGRRHEWETEKIWREKKWATQKLFWLMLAFRQFKAKPGEEIAVGFFCYKRLVFDKIARVRKGSGSGPKARARSSAWTKLEHYQISPRPKLQLIPGASQIWKKDPIYHQSSIASTNKCRRILVQGLQRDFWNK